MPEKKSLKEKLKYCRKPFLISVILLLFFITSHVFEIEPFLSLFSSLVSPVTFSIGFLNFHSRAGNVSALYILSFTYCFLLGLLLKAFWINKENRFFLIGILLIILFLIFVTLPPIGAAGEKARRISCASNLKQIGLALKQYAMDNNGFFPDRGGAEGLEILRKEDYLTDYKLYTCPSTSAIMGVGALAEGNVSYCYKGGVKYSLQNTEPVAWDKFENHNNKRANSNSLFKMKNYGNVLLANGKVIHYEGDEWNKFYDNDSLKKK